jgi:hypothetical protein
MRACTLPEGHSATKKPVPMVEHTRAVGLNAKSHRIWTPANKIRTDEGSTNPVLSVK